MIIKRFILPLCFLLFSSIFTFAQTPKSLVIALDGARADALEISNTPNIKSLINGTWAADYRGAYTPFAQTIKDRDTLSGPNHTSIFTGVTGAKHGVTGNINSQMQAVKYPDYFQLLEQTNSALNTVKLFTWTPDGLIYSGADYKFDGGDDDNATRAAGIIAGIYQDANWALGRNVDALFIFFDDIDGAGHSSGWLSAAYYSEMAQVDGQIGRILNAIKNRPTFASENWQIVLTSDHGGYGLSHGTRASAYYTIPFLVASKTVAQGTLAGRVKNMDAAPTVLKHFGINPEQTFHANFPNSNGTQNFSDSYVMDGTARDSLATTPPSSFLDSMVAYLRMDNSFYDSTGRGNGVIAQTGSPSFVTGKFGSAVRIRAKKGKQYLSFGTGDQHPDLNFGTVDGQNPNFTFTMWYRAPTVSGGSDPCVFCNKNWASGANSGFALTPNVGSGKTYSDELGLNLADSGGRRVDLYRITTKDFPNQWWFFAFTIDRATGLAQLYAGSPDGKLFFVADEIANLQDLRSVLPLNLGQDGTGNYAYQLDADLDDFAVWRRAFSKQEIQRIYNNGAGRELTTLTTLR